MSKPHWIKTSTDKGQKFKCSECNGECICIGTGCASKFERKNLCDYKYCPRCGREMQLEESTVLVSIEQKV